MHVDTDLVTRSTKPAVSAGVKLVLILGALTALSPLAIDMYLPAFPQMAKDLGVDTGTVQLTLSVFMIGVSVGQAFYGPMVDRWGRRGPLLVGMVAFSAAAVGCACARSMGSLLGWRLAMALGGSASMVIPRAVVRDLFDARESARVYSLLMLILGVSPILAPTLGGQLLAFTGWRAIFVTLCVIGGVIAAAVAWGLPETLRKEQRVKGGVVLALKTYGRLLRDRRFLPLALAAGCTLGVILTYLSGSSFVFMEMYGLSAQQYAYVFGLNAVGLIAASQINQQLLKRYTSRQVLSVAFVVNAIAGLALLALGATGAGGMWGLIALLFVCLSGAGIIFPNVAALIMEPFGDVAGSASALLGTVQFGVAAGMGALVGVFYNGTAVPMTAGVAVCALAGLAIVKISVRWSHA
ncbi:Bcr/CflA family drug resistance efflux transporter [Nibricoccus aquaticus]|uniref:Bcr/CflA family drug resistance efflux transporter n=1 Tax=Nibricoccus aquaticus TaxID=2576891 RepID=A0A290Q6D6_9BACT|nr:Bcr/CflA family drug resistance efflux transporter [Nibricoccus aquaticus]